MRSTAKSIVMIIVVSTLVGCAPKIERKGVVVDRGTNAPLEGVSIEIYMKHQRRDSLLTKVFTDAQGRFHIKEQWGSDMLFQLDKAGYISHTNTLSTANDTIRMEREQE